MTSSGKRNAHARSRENRMKVRERSLSASLRFGDLVVVDVDDSVARDSMVGLRVFASTRREAPLRVKVVSDLLVDVDKQKRGKKSRRDENVRFSNQNTNSRLYSTLYSLYVSRIVTLYALLFYMVRLKHLSSLVVQILRLDIHVFQSLLRVHVRRVRVD